MTISCFFWGIKKSLVSIGLLCLPLIALFQCNTKADLYRKDERQNTTDFHEPIHLGLFRDSLKRLPAEVGSSKKALKLFESNFDKTQSNQCDQALKNFIEFQSTLTDELNEKLYNNPDFERLNSLIYADQTLHDSLGIKFQQELNDNGWLLRSTEGTIYIARDTDPIRKVFFKYLSPVTQKFFNQFELEENQMLSEDGGLIIDIIDLADRLGFWETFLQENPNHLFNNFAEGNIKDYRYYILEGMDNTPAFKNHGKKYHNKEFEIAIRYYITKYPQTSSSIIFRNFEELLEQHENQHTHVIKEFIKPYKP
jgi:hypothetical protein